MIGFCNNYLPALQRQIEGILSDTDQASLPSCPLLRDMPLYNEVRDGRRSDRRTTFDYAQDLLKVCSDIHTLHATIDAPQTKEAIQHLINMAVKIAEVLNARREQIERPTPAPPSPSPEKERGDVTKLVKELMTAVGPYVIPNTKASDRSIHEDALDEQSGTVGSFAEKITDRILEDLQLAIANYATSATKPKTLTSGRILPAEITTLPLATIQAHEDLRTKILQRRMAEMAKNTEPGSQGEEKKKESSSSDVDKVKQLLKDQMAKMKEQMEKRKAEKRRQQETATSQSASSQQNIDKSNVSQRFGDLGEDKGERGKKRGRSEDASGPRSSSMAQILASLPELPPDMRTPLEEEGSSTSVPSSTQRGIATQDKNSATEPSSVSNPTLSKSVSSSTQDDVAIEASEEKNTSITPHP